MAASGKFTVISCAYKRLDYLKKAVAALRRQTYENIEIILVNNGATPEVVQYLHELENEDQRVKLIHFSENQSTPNDPAMFVEVCLNPALGMATGDYIWWQSDDDFIADDYAEKMVSLFQGNSECISAAGLPVSVNRDGAVEDTGPRNSNFRPRYMDGRDLALDHAKGGRKLLATPGTIFTLDREALINAGGFRQPLESSHLYGVVPFGVTGFDETALSFWRHHEGQLNREATARGLIGAHETFSLFKDWQIKKRWEGFGGRMAQELTAAIEREQCSKAANWMTNYIYSWRIKAAFRLTRTMWRHPQFWLRIPFKLVARAASVRPIRRFLRFNVRATFHLLSALTRSQNIHEKDSR